MTIQTKPSPQATNNDEGTKLAWYRVGIIWLGIVLTVLIFAGLVHFVYIAHKAAANDAPRASNTAKELTQFKGMSLTQPAEKPSADVSQSNE